MKAFKYENGDRVIQNGRSLMIYDAEVVKQRLVNAIKLDQGSWFFDPKKGIPWFDIYNQKSVSERMIRSRISDILISDTEVTKINSLEIGFDRKERKITVSFNVSTIYGSIGGNV